MNNSIKVTSYFSKNYKRLSKKFTSLNIKLKQLEQELLLNPKIGVPLGNNLYKIRISSKDKGKGKSGGFRIITYLIMENDDNFEINLLTIYDKSEDATITKSVLLKIVKLIFD